MKFSPKHVRDWALNLFKVRGNIKFNQGQDEHGGCVVQRASLVDVEEETIDLWFYTQSLRMKLKTLISEHEMDDELRKELEYIIYGENGERHEGVDK